MNFGQQVINGIVLGSGYACVALGWTILLGVARLVNFAHGQLYMLGAFVAWFVMSRAGVPYVLAIPISILIVAALGARWQQALAAAVGKWLLDYLALVSALYAVGARPRLSLVLLAYGVGAVAGMIPVTPGGLGFVEAGLVGTLALAGIGGEQALLATLAYRIASYWLPLLAGLVGWIVFRRRYGSPPPDTNGDAADATPFPDAAMG